MSSLHEIIANSEFINDRTILYTAAYLKELGNKYQPKQIDEIVAEAHSATTINAEAEFKLESQTYANIEIQVKDLHDQ